MRDGRRRERQINTVNSVHTQSNGWTVSQSQTASKKMRNVTYKRLICVKGIFQSISSRTTVLRPLYRTTCIGRHRQLRTGGFCWSKVLLPACPCWWQLAHSYWEKTLEFSSMEAPASSLYLLWQHTETWVPYSLQDVSDSTSAIFQLTNMRRTLFNPFNLIWSYFYRRNWKIRLQ